MNFTTKVCALALVAGAFASPAAAQDAAATTETPAAAPAPAESSAFTITGGATVVSDYRFRGISQSDRRFAIQGTATVAHESGFYATVWGSSIDDYVAFSGDVELDLVVGYKKTFGGTTIDGGVLYYYYPGFTFGVDTDFAEPYLSVSHAIGPVTGKATVAYAPKQKGLAWNHTKDDNLYVAGDLSYAIPGMPVSLTGHLGHSFKESWITGGEKYTDWSLGASLTKGPMTFGLSYVDTDLPDFYGSSHNITKAGVVASVGVAF